MSPAKEKAKGEKQITKRDEPKADAKREETRKAEEKPTAEAPKAEVKKEEPKSEAKKEAPEKEKPKVDLERVYTIPLRDARKASRRLRAKRAVAILRKFLTRHMKAKEVKITNELNDQIWARGITKFPSKVTVKASRAGGIVTAEKLKK